MRLTSMFPSFVFGSLFAFSAGCDGCAGPIGADAGASDVDSGTFADAGSSNDADGGQVDAGRRDAGSVAT
ncbi:MAG: hypothetical protein GY822_20895 [Deltaproteobacteria bacterium]|nr:hypothetical protein [Deltaproteobacteria bacterium]